MPVSGRDPWCVSTPICLRDTGTRTERRFALIVIARHRNDNTRPFGNHWGSGAENAESYHIAFFFFFFPLRNRAARRRSDAILRYGNLNFVKSSPGKRSPLSLAVPSPSSSRRRHPVHLPCRSTNWWMRTSSSGAFVQIVAQHYRWQRNSGTVFVTLAVVFDTVAVQHVRWNQTFAVRSHTLNRWRRPSCRSLSLLLGDICPLFWRIFSSRHGRVQRTRRRRRLPARTVRPHFHLLWQCQHRLIQRLKLSFRQEAFGRQRQGRKQPDVEILLLVNL